MGGGVVAPIDRPPTDSAATAPVLVFGWGNAARGDDALGPLAVEALQARWCRLAAGDAARQAAVAFLDDHQLAVEHALDLRGRRAVLWVDASRQAAPPFQAEPVQARRDASLSSHALSPQAVMQVYADVQGSAPPPAWVLGIAAREFALGSPPSAAALDHLEAALAWAERWLLAQVPAPGEGADSGLGGQPR